MPNPKRPGFVVVRKVGEDTWKMLGDCERKPGLPARAARSEAIVEATGGRARPGEDYAPVLRSEWRIALDWLPPSSG
jgi:hypothetical protein